MKGFSDWPHPLAFGFSFFYALVTLSFCFSESSLLLSSHSFEGSLKAQQKPNALPLPYPISSFVSAAEFMSVFGCLASQFVTLFEGAERANVTKQPTRDCTGIWA